MKRFIGFLIFVYAVSLTVAHAQFDSEPRPVTPYSKAADGLYYPASYSHPLMCSISGSVADGDTAGNPTLIGIKGIDGNVHSILGMNDGTFVADVSGSTVDIGSIPNVTIGGGTVSVDALPAVSGMVTAIPEYDASKVKEPIIATIATGNAASSITTGCTGSCRRVTYCNTGTTNPICLKFSNSWTASYPIPARAAATSPNQCVAFSSVTTSYWDTNTSGCSGGTTVAVFPEDD